MQKGDESCSKTTAYRSPSSSPLQESSKPEVVAMRAERQRGGVQQQQQITMKSNVSFNSTDLFNTYVEHQEFELAEALLAKQPSLIDSISVNSNDLKLVHKMLVMENLEAFRFLIAHGADVNCFDQTGLSLLHTAVMMENLEIVMFLVERGANLFKAAYFSKLPIDYADGKIYEYLEEKMKIVKDNREHQRAAAAAAATKRHPDQSDDFPPAGDDSNAGSMIYEEKLANYREICEYFDYDQKKIANNYIFLLHSLVVDDIFEFFKFLVEEKHWNVEVFDTDNNTPLHIAVQYDNLRFCDYLVHTCCADINIANINGLTPVYSALDSKREIFELFLACPRQLLYRYDLPPSNVETSILMDPDSHDSQNDEELKEDEDKNAAGTTDKQGLTRRQIYRKKVQVTPTKIFRKSFINSASSKDVSGNGVAPLKPPGASPKNVEPVAESQDTPKVEAAEFTNVMDISNNSNAEDNESRRGKEVEIAAKIVPRNLMAKDSIKLYPRDKKSISNDNPKLSTVSSKKKDTPLSGLKTEEKRRPNGESKSPKETDGSSKSSETKESGSREHRRRPRNDKKQTKKSSAKETQPQTAKESKESDSNASSKKSLDPVKNVLHEISPSKKRPHRSDKDNSSKSNRGTKSPLSKINSNHSIRKMEDDEITHALKETTATRNFNTAASNSKNFRSPEHQNYGTADKSEIKHSAAGDRINKNTALKFGKTSTTIESTKISTETKNSESQSSKHKLPPPRVKRRDKEHQKPGVEPVEDETSRKLGPDISLDLTKINTPEFYKLPSISQRFLVNLNDSIKKTESNQSRSRSNDEILENFQPAMSTKELAKVFESKITGNVLDKK